VLPEDLPLLAACGRPALSPDGATAVVAVTAPSLELDEEVGVLWRVATDAGAPARRLTRGHRDTSPAISPDGRWVAFLRAGRAGSPGARPQLHLVELAGGEPIALTTEADHPLGAGAPVWSPDGSALAYTARVPEAGRYGTLEGVGPEAEPPRLITAPAYRLDGVGFTRDRRPHVFVLDVAPVVQRAAAGVVLDTVTSSVPGTPTVPGQPVLRQVTSGDADDGDVAWARDGSALLFTSDRHPTADTDRRRGVYRVALAGGGGAAGEPELVVGGDLHAEAVAAAADGTSAFVLASATGPDGLEVVARPSSLWSAPLDGSGPPRRFTDPATTDLGDPAGGLVVDDLGALVQDRSRGALRLLRVSAGGDVEVLLEGPLQVTAAASTPDGASVVAVVADPRTPGDLVRVEHGSASPLTDVAAPLRAAGVRPLTEVAATAPDGHPVHGWVVLPDPAAHGEGPHPVLLNIHGGPFAQYGWGLFDEAQVYAGAGYAVVMGNPRGGAGYGEAHGRAVVGAMGGPDADDVLALLDGVLADPALPLDAGRVGVMGGSYGGYMTGLLTTRTDRFAAAVVERGYLDAVSFIGSSDIGWYFPEDYHQSAANLREQSPMTHVDRVTTPTLVVHSEQDWRCPVEQGQRWFTALRRNGVQTELLLFPGEGHELSRSGRPRHRLARLEHVLRWWARWLPTVQNPLPGSVQLPSVPAPAVDGTAPDPAPLTVRATRVR
jgi:dipeptidyl aminopeptidase/acylaminoacyl peptidase